MAPVVVLVVAQAQAPQAKCDSPCADCPYREVCPLRAQLEMAEREGRTLTVRYTRGH